MTLSAATRLTRTSRVEVKTIDDRGVVVDLQTGRCWELNQVGYAIWQRLAEGRSLEEVSSTVASLHDIEIEKAMRDVTAFVGVLVDAGLLEPSSPIPPVPSDQ
jgi:Coenzyme PQQ synthesis protein D (PqqD)